jgi:hypothetical protein
MYFIQTFLALQNTLLPQFHLRLRVAKTKGSSNIDEIKDNRITEMEFQNRKMKGKKTNLLNLG